MSQKSDFVKLLRGIIDYEHDNNIDKINEDKVNLLDQILFPLIYSNKHWLLDGSITFRATIIKKVEEMERNGWARIAEKWKGAFDEQ